MKKNKSQAKIFCSRASELGDGLGTLRNGVLGQFTGQHTPDRGVNVPRSDGGFIVVAGKSRRFLGKLLEDVVDEAVHDSHGLA